MTTAYETIDSHIKRLKSRLHTSIPAVITKVNTEGENIVTVKVSIVNHKVFSTGDIYKRAELDNVPLMFPCTSEFMMSHPVKEGDTVLLLFTQEDIDKFKFEGNTDYTPNTLRQFDINDAVAIPCLQPINSNIKAHKDNFQITFNDFTLSVKPSGGTSLKTNADVSVEAENASESYTGSYTVDANTVSIGNSTTDLVSYLSDLTDQISKITVGGTPIDNKVEFENLKALIDTLK